MHKIHTIHRPTTPANTLPLIHRIKSKLFPAHSLPRVPPQLPPSPLEGCSLLLWLSTGSLKLCFHINSPLMRPWFPCLCLPPKCSYLLLRASSTQAIITWLKLLPILYWNTFKVFILHIASRQCPLFPYFKVIGPFIHWWAWQIMTHN